MKKVVIILLSFLPILVYADTNYIELDCPDEKGTINCKLYTNIDFNITSIEYAYKLPQEIEVKGFNKSDKFEGSMINNRIYLYTDILMKDQIYLGDLIIDNTNYDGNINIESIDLIYSNEEFEDIKIDVNKQEKEEVKTNNNIYYVIILIGIIILIAILIFYIIRRKKI